MSEDHQHETPIKTPKQLLIVIFASFAIPITLIGLLVAYVTGGHHAGSEGAAVKVESIAERIKPVAAVNFKDANAPKVVLTGEQVYQQVCKVCHEAGIAGAPKFGDKAAWGPRIKEGFDDLLKESIKGVRGMPARGGNPDLSDYEVARAVVYMTNAAGATFAEPAAPAAAAATTVTPPVAPAATPPATSAAPAAGAGALPAKVMFSTGKAAIDGAGAKSLAAVAAYLKDNSGAKVTLSGFVDSTGNATKNAELAKQRAFAVRDALRNAGIAEDRIVLRKPEEIKGGDAAEARRVELSLAAAPVAAASAVAPVVAAAGVAGKALYDASCTVCHAAGIGGAPKFGDLAAWAPRIKTGVDAMHASVVKGKGAMPPKGTAMGASDAELKAAVEYMVAAAK